MLRWHRESVILEREDVALDGFSDVLDSGFACVALRDAAWKAGTLGNPRPILAAIEEDLSHVQTIPRRRGPGASCLSQGAGSTSSGCRRFAMIGAQAGLNGQ